jgi:hypothetical protein
MDLPSVIVNGTKRPHTSLRHVRTVLLGKLIMLFRDATGILREVEQRGVKPFGEETFDVIAIAAYRFGCCPLLI